MNQKLALCLMFVFCSSAFAQNSFQRISLEGKDAVAGELIVKVKPENTLSKSASAAVRSKLLEQFNASPVREWMTGAELWKVPPERTASILQNLKQLDVIEYASPNYLTKASGTSAGVPNDPLFGKQWQLHNTGQDGGKVDADIDAPEAWDVTKGDSALIVGVLDTGVEINHPDLKANIWINKKEIPGNGIDDDGNGYIDDINGWDCVDNDSNPDPKGNSHGTVSAGLIAAVQNNSLGVSGVAPLVKIMVIRVLNENGDGTSAQALSGMEYAIKNGAKITNHSYGSVAVEPATVAMFNLAYQRGLLAFASAGNVHFNLDEGTGLAYPAMIDVPNMVSVANSTYQDSLAGSSSYGLREVDVTAPGDFVYTTSVNGEYGFGSGTSASAPMAAGVGALIWSRYPQLTAAEVRQQLMLSSEYVPSLAYYTGSNGRVNAARAVQSLFLSPVALGTRTIAFGGTRVSETAPAQTLMVRNTSGAPVVLDSIAADDGFFLLSSGTLVRKMTLVPIAPRDSLSVQVVFRPSAQMSYRSTVTVYFKNSSQQIVPHYCLVTGQGKTIGTFITQKQISGRWTKQNSPYYINTDVVVENELLIEPGTTIVFSENTYLSCSAPNRLMIRGTASDSIRVTCENPDLGWGGFVLLETKPGDVLIEYAVFEYGKSKPVLITATNFARTRDGGGAVYSLLSSPIIRNCRFSNNRNSGITGSALYIDHGSPVIENSVFSGNISYSNTVSLWYCPSAVLNNLLFFDNVANSVSVLELMHGEYVFNNITSFGNGGRYGIVVGAEAKAVFHNSIFYGNKQKLPFFGLGSYFSAVPSEVSFDHSLVDTVALTGMSWLQMINPQVPGKATWGTGSFLADPKFVNPAAGDFHLSQGSPAIDAGTPNTTGLNLSPTDLAGNSRVANGRIDLGVYESGAAAIAIPTAPALISPQDNHTTSPISPKLQWTSSLRVRSYRVQVSTDPSFASTFAVDLSVVGDTMKSVGPLQNLTKYYWRVAAGNESGTSAWSGTRNFTTVAAPGTPSLLSPADNAVEVAIPAKLTWTRSVGAILYRLQVTSSSSFTSPYVIMTADTTMADTSFTVRGLDGRFPYVWRVAAIGDGGTVWSGAKKFTTALAPPKPGVLLAPSQGSKTVSLPTVLRWYGSSSTPTYRVQIAKDSSFNSIVINDSTLTYNGYAAMSLQPNTTYYWRFCGKNQAGTGPWSTTGNFATVAGTPAGQVPIMVLLDRPANGSTNNPLSLQLYRFDVGGTFYHLQLSTDSTLNTFVLNDTSWIEHYRNIGPLKQGTTYYWRVRARNDFGWGPFSTTWRFTTTGTLGVEQIDEEIPATYSLHQNYPNPFNPSTTIQFGMPCASNVSVKIFDVLGREITTLVSGILQAGVFRTVWDARVPSGVYFYRIQARPVVDGAGREYVHTKRMILIR